MAARPHVREGASHALLDDVAKFREDQLVHGKTHRFLRSREQKDRGAPRGASDGSAHQPQPVLVPQSRQV